MSEQDEVENGEGSALSTSDGVQGVPTETDRQVDDVDYVIIHDEDTIRAVEGGDISHPTGLGEQLPGSELEGAAVIEEASVQQPLLAERDGDRDQTATSSEQGLRYANPYGTFITGIDVNSEVCVHGSSHGNIFNSQKKKYGFPTLGKVLTIISLK